MNYIDVVTESRAKSNILRIVEDIGDSTRKFDQLMGDFFSSEDEVQNRLMWTINHVLDQQPSLIIPYYSKFTNLLSPENSSWIKRGITRMMARIPLPTDDDVLGEMYAKCFEFASDLKEDIAPRAFSIIACERVAHRIPELKEELIPFLEDIHEHSEKAVKNASGHAIKRLLKKR